jgi:hypothetical protein
VGDAQRFFWIILVALSATTASVLGNEIVFGRVPLTRYTIASAGYVVVVLLVFLGPLLIFMPQMIRLCFNYVVSVFIPAYQIHSD